MSIDYLIAASDEEPVRTNRPNPPILASAVLDIDQAKSLVEKHNQDCPEPYVLKLSVVDDVFEREDSAPMALRQVIDLINTVKNPRTQTPTKHTDLLPEAHPMNKIRPARIEAAEYVAAGLELSNEDRAVVRSVLASFPESASRAFHLERAATRKLTTPAITSALAHLDTF